jgi:hypothetical protein
LIARPPDAEDVTVVSSAALAGIAACAILSLVRHLPASAAGRDMIEQSSILFDFSADSDG